MPPVPVLRSERLLLRPLTPQDLDALGELVQHPSISQWWGHNQVAAYVREGFENEGRAFAITTQDDVKTLAGWVGFDEETEPDYRYATLDIALAPGQQQRGLGPEALRTVIRWLVDERSHHRFTIDPERSNERAIAAYAKVGFRPVGTLRRYFRGPDGEWRDGLLMELLAEELTSN
jgi:aminoglycoside 6'-N-acetyltransferase